MSRNEWIRIADLEKKSGVPRRTIHFYLQKGLLHEPVKTGKTMAYYDEKHLIKLRQIKEARKKGLPIAAIRIALNENETQIQTEKSDKRMTPDSKPGIIPSPLSKKKQSQQTRERILDEGCRLFRTKGYKQTKISDITSALNVGKGTFYFYFSDKKALFLECIPRIFNELFASGWERIRTIKNPKSRLETRAQMVLPVLREFCAILHLSKEAMEESDPKIRSLGEMTYHSIRRPIASDIEKGIETGIFRPINVNIAASVFIGIIESLNDLRVFDSQPLSPATWNTVSQLILNGLMPETD